MIFYASSIQLLVRSFSTFHDGTSENKGAAVPAAASKALLDIYVLLISIEAFNSYITSANTWYIY